MHKAKSFLRSPIMMLMIAATAVLPSRGQSGVEFPEELDQEGFRGVIVKSGRFFISGQPDREGYLWLKEQGVRTVVNLRTQEEMDNRDSVPFDEEALLDSLGIQYVHIPQGGDETPYSPEALEKFAAAADTAEGKILLHCTVGWRASHMWGAYLAGYRGLSMEEAVKHARAINFGTIPILIYLGKDLK